MTNLTKDNNYLKLHSRGRKLCDIALKSTTSKNEIVSSESFSDNEEELLLSNNLGEINRLVESPLPEGADLIEIETLSNMISDDILSDEGEDLTENIIPPAVCDQPPILPDNITNIGTPHPSSPDCPRNDEGEDLTENIMPPAVCDQPPILPDKIMNIGTPHPSSPDCPINHLDVDCCNDFCPYFIGSQIREPLSQISVFSGYSTPQANTPLTCYSSDAQTPQSRKKVVRKDKGNLRRMHQNEWIDVKRKTLKNLGKPYVTRKGIQKPKKIMKSPCKCRLKCYEKITNDQRKTIFKAFWELGDHQKQWVYVSKLVSQNLKRRVYVDTYSRRKYTMKYRLPYQDVDNSEDAHLTVCKKQFLSTLSISEQFVYTALQKTDSSTGIVTTDNRGKHNNHPRKLTDAVKQSVCDHIKCLQPVESHYVRKDTSRLYLDSELNFHKLFVLYNEWFDPNIYESKAETERQYKTIANDNFKLSFFKPKKDQCDLCHTYKTNESHSNIDRETYATHILNKNTTRNLKADDKTEAVSSHGRIIAATFDFQKVLNSPYGEISTFYYKRKLGTMNFTVFNLAEKAATCYMWHEAEGKRGANEVSSCLSNFISKCVDTGAVEFRFWSDNCTGQYRNRIVFATYMLMAQKYNITIKHTFLEKGHTQQEGDSVHALIERCARNKCIYTPLEWFTLVRWAKQDGKPYTVIEWDHTKFFDFKSILGNKNWIKNLNGDVVQWTKIKEVLVVPSEPNKLHYKYNLEESQYMTILTKSNTRRRRQQDCTDVAHLYNHALSIPIAKKNDLISLCNSGVIPAVHHNFYRNLLVDSSNLNAETDEE